MIIHTVLKIYLEFRSSLPARVRSILSISLEGVSWRSCRDGA